MVNKRNRSIGMFKKDRLSVKKPNKPTVEYEGIKNNQDKFTTIRIKNSDVNNVKALSVILKHKYLYNTLSEIINDRIQSLTDSQREQLELYKRDFIIIKK